MSKCNVCFVELVTIFLSLGITLSLFLGLSLPVKAMSLEESDVIAALTLHIIRFTSWPNSDFLHQKTLALCVIGDNITQQSFSGINHKNINQKTISVLNLSRLRNIKNCQVIYISTLKKSVLLQIFIETKSHPVLTIGDGDDFVKYGGMVGLGRVNGKIVLRVNLSAVHQANLTISARLLKLANIHR